MGPQNALRAAFPALDQLIEQQPVKMLATDRGALVDSLAWAEDTGNELLASGEEDGAVVFWIRKARDE